MKKTLATAVAIAALALTGCGGDDDAATADPAVDGTGTETTAGDGTGTETTAVDGTGTETTAVDGGGTDTTIASGEESSSGGDVIVPGEDVNICDLVSADELQPFVSYPLVAGDPFFSGIGMNSCDWEPGEDSDIVGGIVSIRLQSSDTYVVIDPNAFPLSGLGDSAEVEAEYGQTNVHIGSVVVTFQVTYNELAHPDVAAAHPEIVAPADAFATDADVHASIAIAEAFADRFGA